jgi:hypothetical protein
MKMTAGSSFAASVKMARMNLLASPYHLLMMADAVTLMKKQRDSAASALASIVLPAAKAVRFDHFMQSQGRQHRMQHTWDAEHLSQHNPACQPSKQQNGRADDVHAQVTSFYALLSEQI